MTLTFIVRVEVSDEYGEKYVPYVKHLLNGYMAHGVEVKSVTYESELIHKENSWAEAVEYEAWADGKIEL